MAKEQKDKERTKYSNALEEGSYKSKMPAKRCSLGIVPRIGGGSTTGGGGVVGILSAENEATTARSSCVRS